MKLSRTVVIIALVMLLVWLVSLLAQPVSAAPLDVSTASQITGTLPGAIDLAQAIDAANARADQWQAAAAQSMQDAQAAINQAYGALANAQAGLSAMQSALDQEHAARMAAEQGQIQQAVSAAQSAQISANTAGELARAANDAAVNAVIAADRSKNAVTLLSADLRQREATIVGLQEANRTQQERIAYLENYGWDQYQRTVTAWVVAGLLGFVLIAIICGGLIIFALERRNRWPRFKAGIEGALVVPINGSK